MACTPSSASLQQSAVHQHHHHGDAGIRVGHYTLTERPTGCTVVLVDGDAVGGVSQRGGAPGTRETDLLNPVNIVDKVNAVVLSGGSAFGLDAASGVVRWLDEKGIGWPTGAGRVPIVTGAILFDLAVGGEPEDPSDRRLRLSRGAGATDRPVQEGSLGAGAGATIGKFGGGRPMKAGIGSAADRTAERPRRRSHRRRECGR